eukprot:1162093-Pelagomonas_calceolata.AAC.7
MVCTCNMQLRSLLLSSGAAAAFDLAITFSQTKALARPCSSQATLVILILGARSMAIQQCFLEGGDDAQQAYSPPPRDGDTEVSNIT